MRSAVLRNVRSVRTTFNRNVEVTNASSDLVLRNRCDRKCELELDGLQTEDEIDRELSHV